MYRIIKISLMIVIFACISHVETNSYRKVLFGTEAREGEFPFIAGFGLMLFIRQIVAPICGGAIINERHILSAAHCADNPDVEGGGRFMVLVGTTMQKLNSGIWYRVEQFFVTPECEKFGPPIEDIVLVRIFGRFEFNRLVQPIALAKPTDVAEGQAIMCGWGQIKRSPKRQTSRKLLKIALMVSSHETCMKYWRKYNPKYNICFESPVSSGTCNGDSGGPAVINNTLFGLLSYGHTDCGNGLPEVYTNIGSFYNWITKKAEMLD